MRTTAQRENWIERNDGMVNGSLVWKRLWPCVLNETRRVLSVPVHSLRLLALSPSADLFLSCSPVNDKIEDCWCSSVYVSVPYELMILSNKCTVLWSPCHVRCCVTSPYHMLLPQRLANHNTSPSLSFMKSLHEFFLRFHEKFETILSEKVSLHSKRNWPKYFHTEPTKTNKNHQWLA